MCDPGSSAVRHKAKKKHIKPPYQGCDIKCSHCCEKCPGGVHLFPRRRRPKGQQVVSLSKRPWNYVERECTTWYNIGPCLFSLFVLRLCCRFFQLKIKTCSMLLNRWPWESDVGGALIVAEKILDRNHCVTWFFGDVPFHAKNFARDFDFFWTHRFHGFAAMRCIFGF